MSPSGMRLQVFGLAVAGLVLGAALGCSSEKTPPRSLGPSIVVLQLPERLGTARRPAVQFDHGLHTDKLRTEGCQACHAVDAESERLTLGFVAEEADLNADQWMDRYHDKCMDCHRKVRGQGHSHAPLTCGRCHQEQPASASARAAMAFDYSLHQRHAEAAEDDCGACHHVYDERTKQLVYKEGAESACRDCHRTRPQGDMPSLRTVSHQSCVNCHLKAGQGEQEAGPVLCHGCHDATAQQQIARLDVVARLERGQPDRTWIHSAGARSKLVPFDHEAHEPQGKSCSTCHHSTLKACGECHTLTGSQEAHGVPLAVSYHLPTSDHSCVGCHQSATRNRQCSGCHHTMQRPPGEHACTVCHSGPQAPAGEVLALPEVTMPELAFDALPRSSEDFPERVVIDVLADRFQPSALPHREIVEHLDQVVRESALAKRFHGKTEALCAGCHHRNPVGTRPAPCRACHGDAAHPTRDQPSLRAAYHRQCIGCHQQMGIEALGCTDCHAKASGKKEVRK